MYRQVLTTISLLLIIVSIGQAQMTKLLRAAQHRSCENLNEAEVSDCTDRWMDDYLAMHVNTAICNADDSTTLDYRINLSIDQKGKVLTAQAYGNQWQDSSEVCPQHITAQLQPLVGSREFIAGSSAEGRIDSRKNFGFTIPSLTARVMDPDSMYYFPEQMPRFVGCEDMIGNDYDKKACAEGQMLMYIYRNLKYPAEAREDGVQGMVVVKFIVEKSGMIDSIKVVRDIGGGCGASARDVVESMNSLNPPFVPGMQRGRAVRVQYTLPVRYKLERGGKKRGKRR